MNNKDNNSKHIVSGFRWLLVLAVGYSLGQIHDIDQSVVAQQRNLGERKAFLSGGERSELVLEKMNKTLERMDQRLASIEKSTSQIASRSEKK